MSDNGITFSTLALQGGKLVETNVRIIKHSDIGACPHFIMVPAHYRDSGSCRCGDPDHIEMSEWGYTWDGSTWIAKEEDE